MFVNVVYLLDLLQIVGIPILDAKGFVQAARCHLQQHRSQASCGFRLNLRTVRHGDQEIPLKLADQIHVRLGKLHLALQDRRRVTLEIVFRLHDHADIRDLRQKGRFPIRAKLVLH